MTYVPYQKPPIRRLQPYQYQPYESGTLESDHATYTLHNQTGTLLNPKVQVYGCLGLLKRGQLVEVDRSGLVGNFVGQTATKTKNIIESAKGGVLFIDEAYSLAKDSENDFGHEAIEILLKAMEDCRDELVVIAAGYGDKMTAFLESNPGLRSRFPRVIWFPDYSAGELVEIFCRIADQNRYVISDNARSILQTEMAHLREKKGPSFANARDVRNLFERVISMQADRVGSLKVVSDAELTTITETDVNLAIVPTRAALSSRNITITSSGSICASTLARSPPKLNAITD